MVMGERGMKDMTEMEMPLPDNTAAMMTGTGPFGAVGMGSMFSVVKVRKDQKRGDYSDPGWYQHPPGTVAYKFHGGHADHGQTHQGRRGQGAKNRGRPFGPLNNTEPGELHERDKNTF